VLALEEPYREALLQRYVQGLEPAEIARTLGVPASTVRNRIARGLELVRARMDARHGGERGAWAALLAPMAGAGLVTGGAIVSTKWVAAGVLALVSAVWLVMRATRERELGPETATGDRVAALELRSKSEEEVVDPARTLVSTRTELTDAPTERASPSSATLIVHARWGRDGSPAAGIPLYLNEPSTFARQLSRWRETDAQGTVRFDGLRPGAHSVDGLRGGKVRAELLPDTTTEVELVIPPGIDVSCRVVDHDGLPVAGADVWLSGYGNDSMGDIVGRTDSGGTLLVRDVGEGRNVAARAAGHAPSTQHRIGGVPGEKLQVTLALRGPGASLEGFVRDERGRPLSGAELLVGPDAPALERLANGTDVSGPAPVQVRCDANGWFHVDGVPPGRLPVSVRATGHAPVFAEVLLSVAQPTRMDFALTGEARVRGVVRDSAGEPVGGALVAAVGLGFGTRLAHSAEDGSYELGGLPDGSVSLRASRRSRGSTSTPVRLRRESVTVWDATLVAGGRLAGVVLDERGAPLEHWHVAAVERRSPGLWMREDRTDAGGRFELLDCPVTPFVLAVRSPLETFGAPVVFVDDFDLGQDDLMIRIRDADVPSAYVVGSLRNALPGALVQPRVGYESEWNTGSSVPVGSDGRFRIGPLRAGRYTFEVSAEDRGRLYLSERAIAANHETDLGELLLEPPGFVRVRAVAEDGRPVDAPWAELVAEGRTVSQVRFDGPIGSSKPLAPGTYVLRLRTSRWSAPEQQVEVLPGETTDVEVVLQPATSRLLVLTLPASDPATSVHVLVRDTLGATVEDYGGTDREGERFRLSLAGLVPGTYSVEARTDSGLVAAGSFAVHDLARTDEPIELALR
jgi:hypothetical protein